MIFNWEKYKRVFAFGCSFTQYCYPTWADIIFNEITGECYNFGIPGLGNLAISSRIAEANQKFKFSDTDLVIVMYTSLFREDRWLEGRWQAHGCIYSQKYYESNFVKKYVDPTGCAIRDLSIIELSTSYVQSLSCDSLLLRSADLWDEENVHNKNSTTINKVSSLYNTLWDSFPPSLKETLFPNGWETRSSRIINNRLKHDTHPNPKDYYDYLISLGINLSESTRVYAADANEILKGCVHSADLPTHFPELARSCHNILF